MDNNLDDSKDGGQLSSSEKKITLKILEEIDKEFIEEVPPNFHAFFYTRIHNQSEGKLHE
jgi:hypothetical protein